MAFKFNDVSLTITTVGTIAGLFALFLIPFTYVERDKYDKFKLYASDPDRYIVLERSEYDKLKLSAAGKVNSGVSSQTQPSDPRMGQHKDPVTPLDGLIKEAFALKEQVGKVGFFDNFDDWRTRATNQLRDLREPLGVDYVSEFKTKTQTMDPRRNMTLTPYRDDEYKNFIDGGQYVLNRANSSLKRVSEIK